MNLSGCAKTHLLEHLQSLLNEAWPNADKLWEISNDGHKKGMKYKIMLVPNIVNIT